MTRRRTPRRQERYSAVHRRYLSRREDWYPRLVSWGCGIPTRLRHETPAARQERIEDMRQAWQVMRHEIIAEYPDAWPVRAFDEGKGIA